MTARDTLWGHFDHARAAGPDRAALVDAAGTALSYAELGRRAEAVAGGLSALGVRSGDRVVVHLARGVEEVVAHLATARLGAVIAGLHPQQTEANLRALVRDVAAAAVITEGARAAALAARPEAGVRVIATDDVASPDGAPLPRLDTLDGALPPLSARGEDLGALFLTSGSTGRPKAVMHTQASLVRCGRDAAAYLRYRPDERLLGLLPPSFHYGFNQLTSAFAVGACIVFPASTFAGDLPGILAERRITGVAGLPFTWTQLVAALEAAPRALPDLRFVTSAGGALDPAVVTHLRSILPHVRVHLLYGLTEALRTTHLPPEDVARFPGAMGRPVPGVEVFVVDGERACGPDEIGELVHRGPTVARGYWGAPEATAETFRPAPFLGLPPDERLCWSGDLVRRDASGLVWFVSRKDWLIKTSGFRVGPIEVEEGVLASGLVRDAVAFGAPDPLLGQAVEVAVTTPGDAPIDTSALRRLCRAVLPAYMVPRRVHHWRGALPLTPAGKPARAEIVRACLAGLPPEAPPEPE